MCRAHLTALLYAVLFILVPACDSSYDSGQIANGPTVYYLAKSSQAQLSVASENTAYDGAGSREEFALDMVFRTPTDPLLEPAFQEEVKLLGFDLSDGVAHVDLSEEYTVMEGIDLTLADACVVLTLTQFPEIGYVKITASGRPHPLHENRLFTRDDFLTGVQGLDPREVELGLFFADSENRFVARELQSISIRDSNFAVYMVDMLIAGPKSGRLRPVIPEGTRLLSLTVEESTCFVSFSEEFVSSADGDAASARMTLTALANSLTGLDGIDKVDISIDGVPLREYFMYDVSGGLRRETEAVISYSGTDVNLYYSGVGGELVSVAAKVPEDSLEGFYTAVLNEYFTRAEPIGLKWLFPENTSISSLETEYGTARLHLSGELTALNLDPAAPYALLKILADISQIRELELYVGGKRLGLYMLTDIKP